MRKQPPLLRTTTEAPLQGLRPTAASSLPAASAGAAAGQIQSRGGRRTIWSANERAAWQAALLVAPVACIDGALYSQYSSHRCSARPLRLC